MNDRHALEKLEVLNGDRRGARDQAALRRGDLKALAAYQMQSRTVTDETLSVADHNALVADIEAILSLVRSL